MKDFQRNNPRVALEQCRWKIFSDEGSAALLGIPATTLISRIKKWNLKKTLKFLRVGGKMGEATSEFNQESSWFNPA